MIHGKTAPVGVGSENKHLKERAMESRPWTEDLIRLDPPALYGSECSECHRRAFPLRAVCPECRLEDGQERVALGGRGVLASYTIVRQAPPGMEVPYALGYVDLPDDDVRLLSRVAGPDLERLRLGMDLQLELIEFGRDGDTALIGWQFKALEAAS